MNKIKYENILNISKKIIKETIINIKDIVTMNTSYIVLSRLKLVIIGYNKAIIGCYSKKKPMASLLSLSTSLDLFYQKETFFYLKEE